MDAPFPKVLLYLSVCSAYPLNRAVKKENPNKNKNVDLVQQYLQKYYNLAREMKLFMRGKGSSPDVKKIQEMQKFLGLEVMGKLDSDTLEVMHKPRCGVPDVGSFTTFPGMPKWRKTHLTYRIVNYTLDLPRDAVDYAIVRALKVWEEVTPLTFSRIYKGEADIMITFAIDGPGQVLAHAYPPGLGIYEDDHEQWTKDTAGTNLFLVAAHELGHSLGLSHLANTATLMFLVYNPFTDLARFHLSQDDVNGIQSLYGPPSASPDEPAVPTESIPPETPAMCDPTLSFDTVSTLRGEFLFFKDRYIGHESLWKLEPEFHLISVLWSSLPSGLDATCDVPSKGTTFVSKGNKLRRAIRGNEVQKGYTRDIHTHKETKREIDAAVSDEEKKTCFFVETILEWVEEQLLASRQTARSPVWSSCGSSGKPRSSHEGLVQSPMCECPMLC
ncbi:stromelysin-2-like [Sturnira hondurensis]|uniref:stromelysin-2-like n=1 Tax=Sturnira hondurensis TaxID=192404 RepID=UPI00187A7BD1|nr:stromelysin-2-like [Sturnira hondurensis]